MAVKTFLFVTNTLSHTQKRAIAKKSNFNSLNNCKTYNKTQLISRAMTLIEIFRSFDALLCTPQL